MIIFQEGLIFSSLSCESLSSLFNLLDSSCSDMIVSSISVFLSYLFFI